MVKRICNMITIIILSVMMVITGILLLPYLFGYKTYSVLSGSMEQQYHVGSLVFVKPTSADDIKVGDAITFSLSGSMVATHRVKSIDTAGQTFETKGDANDSADPNPVSFTSLIGRAAEISVPCLGYLAIFIKTTQGIITAVCILLGLILLDLLPDIFVKKDCEMPEGKLI